MAKPNKAHTGSHNACTCHAFQLCQVQGPFHQQCEQFTTSASLSCSWTLELALYAQVALHYKLCKPRQLHMNLAEVLRAHLELPHAILPGPINYAKSAGELRAFMSVRQLQAGCTLFTQVHLFYFPVFPFCLLLCSDCFCYTVAFVVFWSKVIFPCWFVCLHTCVFPKADETQQHSQACGCAWASQCHCQIFEGMLLIKVGSGKTKFGMSRDSLGRLQSATNGTI